MRNRGLGNKIQVLLDNVFSIILGFGDGLFFFVGFAGRKLLLLGLLYRIALHYSLIVRFPPSLFISNGDSL